MIQMILDEALQQSEALSEALKELQQFQFNSAANSIATHSLAVVITAGCAILLLRTAAGTRPSRFLKHLAISIILNAMFRLASIVYLLLKALMASHVQGLGSGLDNPVIARIALASMTLDKIWHGTDITISFLSTLFLFVVWDLLRRYPHEAVSRSFFTLLTALFGSTSLLAVTISLIIFAEKIQAHLWDFLNIMDVGSAAIVLSLVGWQLQTTLGPVMKIKNRVLRATLPWMTTFTYFIWGGVQPFYYWLRNLPWYSIFLLMSGFCATIMTIILCSQSLDEKPEYNSSDASMPLKTRKPWPRKK
jgi:hypothetical protein